MGETIGVDEFVNGSEDILMTRNILESVGTIFLDPGAHCSAYMYDTYEI